MSRASSGDRIEVKPTSNIYTVLAICAVLVNIICFLLILARWTEVFGSQSSIWSQH